MSIGLNIKSYRQRAGLTQNELADKLGVARSTVTQWENGLSNPRMGMVVRLANTFGVMSSDLVAENNNYSTATDPVLDRLIQSYISLNPEGRVVLAATVETLSKELKALNTQEVRSIIHDDDSHLN